ncbi:carotenoid oxygenase family protein [Sphingomonas sp. G-3-2-10]|uniref:8'-apo-carotenoid 13,14-cleaving dioxygenase n=1 Tax=Sphingomonas sp. G-3-2-10 TaxID=2728838 RepID=UPI00146EA372|nr:carotenoid oxygenase family protein [Sphingomonas sp. G-3-2-10]NML05137.1 carotenoid oxygenase family protein [Sphingomonas sp. G-3-2-10]
MASTVETAIRSAVTSGVMTLAKVNRALASAKPNPFVEGIHAPMGEELTIGDLPVTGTIPAQLDGRYLRIGPNPIDPQPGGHWFTGDGMVHGLRIEGGKALWYRNRWTRSADVSRALGEAPIPSPRGDTSIVNTNVLGHAGRTWALTEAGVAPIELGETLESLAYNAFDGTLQHSFTAHPHLDPLTGELHAICYKGQDQSHVWHTVVTAEGKVRREEPVAVEHGPSIHDCAITARYAIVLDLPVTFSMRALIGGARFPYKWNPAHKARVGLLPREGRGDEIIWCDVDPCYVFHVANAYDAPDGTVILDVAAHTTMFAESTVGPDSAHSAFERWTVDPKAGRVTRTVIDDNPQEFPRPDERRFGQPYRYAYTMALNEGAGFLPANHLIKHDLEAGTRQIHAFGADRYPGEFVFVPTHADAAEDEGWLIGLVVHHPAETTDLVIIDAAKFEGAPVASVRIPHRVPPGFHGNWVAKG